MKIIIILTAIILLFLIGCTSSPNITSPTYNFKQGVSELNFRMLPNAPPDKIYPESNFKLILEADNKAAYDINNLAVNIVGLDDKYFLLNVYEQKIPTMYGKSLNSPIGDKQFLEFDGVSNKLFQNAQYYTGNYIVKASYQSKIEFADTICLNPNLYSINDAGCKVQDKKSYGGQGGPLAVDGIEEITYPSGTGGLVEFRVNLANKGRGKVNTVHLITSNLGGEEMECEFLGENVITQKLIKMTNEKQQATLRCKTFIKEQNSYASSLSLSFTYDYEFKQQFKLNLVK
ncbi:hypothetical protein HYX11_01300 [Candidatus Woesearchaeota archaeon]|nr:hypothetical protein [Candidatus Woesearchaeota archaeon]